MKKIISFFIAFAAVFALNAQSLSELGAKRGFKMGAVISSETLQNPDYRKLVTTDFNSITAANEFKAYSLLSASLSRKNPDGMPGMDFSKADEIMDFAKENGLRVRGHVLVWDAYMTDWFFKEKYNKAGKFVDAETMKKRLESYINDVITHFETKYPGVIYCWDVVNEAVADSQAEAAPNDKRRVRKTRGGNRNYFYDTIGADYVELSFKYAREAVRKTGADIKLYYNDYNTFYSDKTTAICNLIKSINKDEKLCDGVGMQGYIGGYGKQDGCMNTRDIASVKTAIQTFAKLGCEVQITELAVRNYKNDSATQKAHAAFYESLFNTLKTLNDNGTILTAVSIWGLVDEPDASPDSYSYKMNGPYCGIFTEKLRKKASYDSLVRALKS